jgi:hypothetical protein
MGTKVTHIFLNWRRSDQLAQIVQGAYAQDVSKSVVVIDNAAETEHEYTGEADLVLPRDNSKACWERWLFALRCATKYVCVMDDDLCYRHRNTLREAVRYMDENDEVDAVGMTGVLDPSKYWKTQTEQQGDVAILKGRYMLVRVSSLEGLNTSTEQFCDDIKVSAHLKRKVVLPFLRPSLDNMHEGDEALWKQPTWRKQRRTACVMYHPYAFPAN